MVDMFLVYGNNVFPVGDGVLCLVYRVEDSLRVDIGEVLESLAFYNLYKFRDRFRVSENVRLTSRVPFRVSGLLAFRGRSCHIGVSLGSSLGSF